MSLSVNYTDGASLVGASWFDQNWMFVGLPFVSILCVVYARLWREPILSRRFFHWTLAPWYLLHQFEEHAWDVRGHRYPFIDWFNAVGHFIGREPTDGTVSGVLTPRLITLVNVPIVWVLFPAGAWIADRHSDIPMVLLWALSTFNASVGHVILGLVTTAGVYNPGFIQSVCMTAAGLYYLIGLRKLHKRKKLALACIIVGGPVFHLLGLALPGVILRSLNSEVAEWLFLVFECLMSAVMLLFVTKVFHSESDVSPPVGSPLHLKMAAADGSGDQRQADAEFTSASVEISEKGV